MILEKQQRNARAFTLIEVLIALTIFAVLLAAIDGLFWGAMHLQIKTTDAVDEGLPAEHAAMIIKRDVENIVLPSGSPADSNSTGATSSQTGTLVGPTSSGATSGMNQTPQAGIKGIISLELYTSTGVISDDLPWGDIQKVDYSLEAPTNRMSQGKDLVRSVTRNLLATTPEVSEQQRLFYNVQKLQVTFFDGTNWMDTWNPVSDTNYLTPAAIRFQIDMVPDPASGRNPTPPIEWLFPVPVGLILTNTTIIN